MEIAYPTLGKGFARLSRDILEGVNQIFQKALVCETEEELGQLCLHVAEELTQSRFGFVALLDAEGLLSYLAINNPGSDACQMDDQKCHQMVSSGLSVDGIYGRVLREGKGLFTNNPAAHPDNIGLPQGHPPLSALLAAPLICDDEIIGLVGLGNRPGGYRNHELFTLNALSVAMVQALRHKQTEVALRTSEEQFRALFESSSAAMAMADPATGRIMKVNRTYTERLGYTPEDLADKTFSELTDPADREQDWVGFSRLVRGEIPFYSVEKRLLHKAGHTVWCLVSVKLVRDAAGQPVRSVAIIHDISVRKDAEIALAQAKDNSERERDILQAVMNGAGNSHLVYLDCGFNFVRVNDLYARTCGYQPDEMIGKNHFDLFPHPENETIFAFVRDTGEPVHYRDRPFEFPNDPERGVTYWDWTLTPVKKSADQVVGLVLSLFETTKQKQTEFDLAAAKKAAEAATHAKSQFLANMSHEIRTPMTVFLGALEHLQQIDQNPDHRTLLEMAEKSAKSLRGLIEDILDFSRIEEGRLEIRQDLFALGAWLDDTLGMFILPAREKSLQLTTTVSADVPAIIVGDPARLRQVLNNLVSNAIKFTPTGEICVSVRNPGDRVEFSVADTGIGIAEEQQDLLFESFRQVDMSFQRKYGGTGLGLAISRSLVELMGGELTVQSRTGEGSVFKFSIPLKTETTPIALPHAEPEDIAGELTAGRILVAEDDAMIRTLMIMELARNGWHTETAESGKEAVEKWRRDKFDIILMDLQMPDMDGLAATRLIRREEAGQGKRGCIIGFTAHAQKEIAGSCLDAGMDDVLIKPFKMNLLHAAIKQHFSA